MSDVRNGMKWGLIIAALLCAWVAILIPLNGGLVFRNRHGAEYNALMIMLLYLMGGLTVGALFGSMNRFLPRRPVAFCVGVISMIPLGAAILATENNFAGWGRLQTLTLIIVAIVFGGPGGLIIGKFFAASKSQNRSPKHQRG